MIKKEEIKHLAALARISISEDELASLLKEFDGILSYVGQIESLTLSTGTSPEVSALRNVFRKDECVAEDVNTKALIDAFPEKEGDLLSVKQIITYE